MSRLSTLFRRNNANEILYENPKEKTRGDRAVKIKKVIKEEGTLIFPETPRQHPQGTLARFTLIDKKEKNTSSLRASYHSKQTDLYLHRSTEANPPRAVQPAIKITNYDPRQGNPLVEKIVKNTNNGLQAVNGIIDNLYYNNYNMIFKKNHQFPDKSKIILKNLNHQNTRIHIYTPHTDAGILEDAKNTPEASHYFFPPNSATQETHASTPRDEVHQNAYPRPSSPTQSDIDRSTIFANLRHFPYGEAR